MAKNFATLYASSADSRAINQSWFIVEETTRGTFAAPTNTDFLYTRAGGSVQHVQPFESSDHRSGRHNTDIIRQKKETSWNLPMYVNIDTNAVQGTAELDTAVRVLWKSMLGTETIPGGVVFTSADDPDITFSIYENGDIFSHQVRGSFVMSCSFSAPGDGTATMEFSGMGADRLRVGIGQSTTLNNANTVTLVNAAEAKRFPVGAQVMIIKGDGTTRSTDTPDGVYRTVTASDDGTGIVTLSGAVLGDADGSGGAGTEVYLAYAEPATPTGIADIQTGLVGSMAIDGLGGVQDCIRAFNLNMDNGHEPANYCYGTDGLASPYFIAGGRLQVGVEVEQNVNHEVVEWLYDLDQFTAQDLDFIIGDSAGRHLRIDLPKVIFEVPSVEIPEEGSIPFTSTGTAFQTALEAADEITVSYL